MAFKICLSGTTDIVAGTENFNQELIETWLAENQVFKPSEGSEGYDSWEYPDTMKYVLLNIEDGEHKIIKPLF